MPRKRVKESYLDEAAIAGGGVGVAYSISEYNKLRKTLFKDYAKNAFRAGGFRFNNKKYKKWLRPYLNQARSMRESRKFHVRGMAFAEDFKHFNPKYLTKKSESMLKGMPLFKYGAKRRNWQSFKRIAPKRLALITGGLAGSVALPSMVYKYQNKDWKDEAKKIGIQLAAPAVAVLGAYGAIKYGKRLKALKGVAK